MRSSIATVLALLALPSFVACSSGPEALPPIGASADGGPSIPGQQTSPQGDRDASVLQPSPAPLPPAPAPKAEDINEATAIFVAKHGESTNPGTRKSPLASISAALEKAKTDKKARVFVCEGTYEESLELENGISIVGGLDCAGDSWKLTEKRSLLASPVSPAIHAVKIDKATRIDNFDVHSPDATQSSGSSFAVVAVDSNALTFAKGTIAAGAATKGDDGAESLQLRFVLETWAGTGGYIRETTFEAKGNQDPGGQGGFGTCYDSENLPVTRQGGGRGASSGVYWHAENNNPWTTIVGSTPEENGTAGGGGGANGANANGGAIGENGYAVANGTAGTSGEAGGGGRGGSTSSPAVNLGRGYWLGKAGPGGGVGGCPGMASTAGKGGGASLGIVAIRSPLRLEDMTVTSQAGGAAGKGTFGSQPTAGTAGGNDGSGRVNSNPGGSGGAAGISGNGAAGPSIAVAYQGLALILTRTTTTPGDGGAGVEARSANGKTIPATPAGVSEGVKAL